MAIERTFSIIKPDATARNLTGAVNAMIEQAGLRIIAQKRVRITKRAGRDLLRRAQGAAVLRRTGRFHDLGPGGGPGARRRERDRQVPRHHGRHRSGQGRAEHHPQGPRQVDRRELGARLGRAGHRGARKSRSSSPATKSSADSSSETWRCATWLRYGQRPVAGGLQLTAGCRGCVPRRVQDRPGEDAGKPAKGKERQVGYLLADFMQPAFWIAVGQIIWINILLSGDNAVVIALACRSLPPQAALLGHPARRRRRGPAPHLLHHHHRADHGGRLPQAGRRPAAALDRDQADRADRGARRGQRQGRRHADARGLARDGRRHRDEPRQRHRDRGRGRNRGDARSTWRTR